MLQHIFRTEHPKPQFERSDWENLNGIWEFEKDFSDSGESRGLQEETAVFSESINVPFCPESRMSGVEFKDFMQAVWYKRSFDISAEKLKERVVLHFGACDYITTVYVNGRKCGSHTGGFVSFSFDITEYVRQGKNTLTVYVRDDARNPLIPTGKQSDRFYSYGCFYTRTTGIWQTVWLEFTPKVYIKSAKYYPDVNSGTLTINAIVCGKGTLHAAAYFEGEFEGDAAVDIENGSVVLTLPLKEKHLWEIGNGRLYDLYLTFGEDRVKSYFGLRSIDYRDKKFYLNGKSVFQRLVLDQGFYPDGIYTAPSDDELAADIDRSMAMGFNGARLHEKIFEERFLYHCDRKGYIVWGEYPNWGLDVSNPKVIYNVLPEWIEEINRDFNHPSIVGWCPFNETWDYDGRKQYDDILSVIYHTTKAIDSTRPCIDTSGFYHVITDIFDLHDYTQNSSEFRNRYSDLDTPDFGENKECIQMNRQQYDGKLPFFISEYGGIRWADGDSGWGYGDAPKTKEEFLERLKGLNDALLDNENIFAFCYTQLTDVEQEQNGLYTYDRKPKFPPEQIYPLFARKAAIEE